MLAIGPKTYCLAGELELSGNFGGVSSLLSTSLDSHEPLLSLNLAQIVQLFPLGIIGISSPLPKIRRRERNCCFRRGESIQRRISAGQVTLDRLAQVLYKMPTICDLKGLRGTTCHCLPVFTGTIASHDRDRRLLLKPLLARPARPHQPSTRATFWRWYLPFPLTQSISKAQHRKLEKLLEATLGTIADEGLDVLPIHATANCID